MSQLENRTSPLPDLPRSSNDEQQHFLDCLYANYAELHAQDVELQERKRAMVADTVGGNTTAMQRLISDKGSDADVELGDWDTWERVENLVRRHAYGRPHYAEEDVTTARAWRERAETLNEVVAAQKKRLLLASRTVQAAQEELCGLLSLLQIKDRDIRQLSASLKATTLQLRQAERDRVALEAQLTLDEREHAKRESALMKTVEEKEELARECAALRAQAHRHDPARAAGCSVVSTTSALGECEVPVPSTHDLSEGTAGSCDGVASQADQGTAGAKWGESSAGLPTVTRGDDAFSRDALDAENGLAFLSARLSVDCPQAARDDDAGPVIRTSAEGQGDVPTGGATGKAEKNHATATVSETLVMANRSGSLPSVQQQVVTEATQALQETVKRLQGRIEEMCAAVRCSGMAHAALRSDQWRLFSLSSTDLAAVPEGGDHPATDPQQPHREAGGDEPAVAAEQRGPPGCDEALFSSTKKQRESSKMDAALSASGERTGTSPMVSPSAIQPSGNGALLDGRLRPRSPTSPTAVTHHIRHCDASTQTTPSPTPGLTCQPLPLMGSHPVSIRSDELLTGDSEYRHASVPSEPHANSKAFPTVPTTEASSQLPLRSNEVAVAVTGELPSSKSCCPVSVGTTASSTTAARTAPHTDPVAPLQAVNELREDNAALRSMVMGLRDGVSQYCVQLCALLQRQGDSPTARVQAGDPSPTHLGGPALSGIIEDRIIDVLRRQYGVVLPEDAASGAMTDTAWLAQRLREMALRIAKGEIDVALYDNLPPQLPGPTSQDAAGTKEGLSHTGLSEYAALSTPGHHAKATTPPVTLPSAPGARSQVSTDFIKSGPRPLYRPPVHGSAATGLGNVPPRQLSPMSEASPAFRLVSGEKSSPPDSVSFDNYVSRGADGVARGNVWRGQAPETAVWMPRPVARPASGVNHALTIRGAPRSTPQHGRMPFLASSSVPTGTLEPTVLHYELDPASLPAGYASRARTAIAHLFSPSFDHFLRAYVLPIAETAQAFAKGRGLQPPLLAAIHQLRYQEAARRRRAVQLLFKRVATHIRARRLAQRHVVAGNAFPSYIAALYERWRRHVEEQRRNLTAPSTDEDAVLLQRLGLPTVGRRGKKDGTHGAFSASPPVAGATNATATGNQAASSYHFNLVRLEGKQ